jgi:hypothetical protein
MQNYFDVYSCTNKSKKYFVPGLVLVDLYLGISGKSILVAVE